jgi:penicillin-binding protein 1A
MQAAAEAALQTAISEQGDELNVSQGAVLIMDNGGAVHAMVGGVDYEHSQYNRAYQARRQPGSAFKPFVYLTALNQGFAPSSVWSDRPIRINGWTPANYSGRYRGDVTLDRALTSSLNTVAVGLGNRLGLENVADTARNLGIRSPIRIHPSLPLGTSEVSLLELTGAYAAIARGGSSVPPYIVSRVLDSDGKVVYERKSGASGGLGAGRAIADLSAMLARVVERGTGRTAQLRGRHVAGKTGTTQEYRDAWFIGFTDSYTAGVWVGNDDYSPMNKVTGGTLPARIWRDAMVEIVGEDEAEPEPRVALNDAGAGEDASQEFDPFAALDEIDRHSAPRMDGMVSYYARGPRVWSAEEFSRSQQQARPSRRWGGGFLRRLFR